MFCLSAQLGQNKKKRGRRSSKSTPKTPKTPKKMSKTPKKVSKTPKEEPEPDLFRTGDYAIWKDEFGHWIAVIIMCVQDAMYKVEIVDLSTEPTKNRTESPSDKRWTRGRKDEFRALPALMLDGVFAKDASVSVLHLADDGSMTWRKARVEKLFSDMTYLITYNDADPSSSRSAAEPKVTDIVSATLVYWPID